ncbi:MAG: TIR domain-containing protein [Candidatus Contendobacter sp.]|nr:TIR domain-containing protein [Candidatus Contendobacter sp.]MDG4558836.1 TIR domain-containing protein [Candidatus Contendobacter sp.]
MVTSNTEAQIPDKFLVAFSFAGEQRERVTALAEAVEKKLGIGTVFLDQWYEHYIAGPDADIRLQKIYAERSALVVVCVSERYGGKPWTLVEHEAIRARLMKARTSPNKQDRLAILPVRVGEGEVEGFFFNAIIPDIRNRTPAKAAVLIIERLRLIIPDQGLVSGDDPQAAREASRNDFMETSEAKSLSPRSILRECLQNSFANKEDAHAFCFDYCKDVFKNLGDGMSFSRILIEIIQYYEVRGKEHDLWQWIRERNVSNYLEWYDKWKDATTRHPKR